MSTDRETTPVSGVITVRQVVRREEANASKLLSKTFKRIVLKPKMGLTNKGAGSAHLCHSSPTTVGRAWGRWDYCLLQKTVVPLPTDGAPPSLESTPRLPLFVALRELFILRL